MSYFLNNIYNETLKKYYRSLSVFPVALAFLIIMVIKPHQQYRYLDEAAYIKLIGIIDNTYQSYEIELWSDYSTQTLNNVKNMEFASVDLNEVPEKNQKIAQIVLLDFKTELINPIKSREYGYELVNLPDFLKNLAQENKSKIVNSTNYEKKIEQLGFNQIWQNKNFKIYVKEFT